MSDQFAPWTFVPLKDVVAEVTSGATPQSGNPRYYSTSEGVPFARIDDLTRSSSMYLNDTSLRVTPAAMKEAGLRRFPPGTVLVSMYGTIGLVKVTSTPLATNQAMCALVPPFKCDTSFLFHYLTWIRPSWDKYMGQTTQANISGSIIRKASFPLVPLEEQRRIAEILDALDARISVIDAQLRKLEDRDFAVIATLLAKTDSRPSALGCYLLDRPKNGFSPAETDGWTGMRALGLGCLTPRGFRPVQLKNVPNDADRNRAATLVEGDLLMSRANTRDLVGLAGIYRDIGMPCIYPDLMMRLQCNSDCIPDFLELLLRSPDVRRQIKAYAQGTSESMVKISSSIVLGLQVRVPSLDVQKDVLRAVRALQKEAEQLREERLKSGAIRSGLAEDLLSGRVRV